jgi:hypothetical protein
VNPPRDFKIVVKVLSSISRPTPDSPRLNVFLELLNIHATFIADFPKSDSDSFQGMDGYPPVTLLQANPVVG